MFSAEYINQIIVAIAGLLYIIAVLPYVKDIVQGKTKPHPVSWLLWTVIGFVNFIFYPQTGATYTQILAYTTFFIPLIILIFSLRYWHDRFSKLDYLCLSVSLLSLIIGLLFDSPVLGLTLNILISDFIAFIPTIVKTHKDPESENKLAWSITVAANVLTILVINKWTFGIILLPLYTFVMNSVVLAETFKKKKM